MMTVNSKDIDLLGVTTVFRNAEKRGKIAKAILHEMNEDILVYAGLDDPFNQDVYEVLSDEVKKVEKFDKMGKYLPPQYKEEMDNFSLDGNNAVEFINSKVVKYPNEVTLVGIGPLTNLATFIKTYPKTAKLVKEVVIMGGGVYK